ncbi:MAG: zinc-dependent metalloprotease family protein [bacterium]
MDRPAVLAAEGAGNDLHRLFQQHDAPGGVGLFLVGRLAAPFGTDVAGVAGGLPGPPILAGTTRSGVAVSMDIGLSPRATGQVIAHELGHYLGLLHTVEPGGLPDPLPDTPDDPADTANLMAPRVTDAPVGLTPQQGEVLRSGAALDSP